MGFGDSVFYRVKDTVEVAMGFFNYKKTAIFA